MPRDSLADSSRTMINQGRCAVSVAHKHSKQNIGPIDPHALKIPRPKGGNFSSSVRRRPHFHAEPKQKLR